MDKSKLIRKFDKQARIYEGRKPGPAEKEWREQLLKSARGNVLEVGVGTGANFAYYPKDVHVTAVDFSGEMLSRAKESAVRNAISAEFMRQDIESLSFPENTFDTIVSTLTLCGYEDPLHVLRQFKSWCKPDGRILLMEHGISSSRVIGLLQHWIDPVHVRMIGCHLNRDIKQLITQAGLEIERMERHFLNAIYLAWTNPGKANA